MEEEKLKKYLESINKMIKSGNPKYMSLISREYMKHLKTSPVVAEGISDMIYKETVRNEKSPYAIFIHDNGAICFDAMNDISKLSNLSEFIGHVEELSKYGIDFSTVTPDDLILEADEMIEELEKELENTEFTEESIEKTTEKAETSLAKIGFLATLGGAIGGAASALFSKMKSKIASLKSQKGQAPIKNKQESQKDNDTQKTASNNLATSSRKSFDEICPKVEINEKEVLNNLQNKPQEAEISKRKNTDTYGDGDPDGDDLGL